MENTTQPDRPASTGKTANRKPARRREVYPPDEIAHRWANGADAFDIRGGNLSTRHGDGKAKAVWLYSYGMPIGVRFLHKRVPHFIIAPSDLAPSRTTGAHLWQAVQAVPDRARLFRAPVLMGGNVGTISYRYNGALTAPDADAHRRNVEALKAEATARALDNARRRVNVSGRDYVAQLFATPDAYRVAFLPKRAPILAGQDILRQTDEAVAGLRRREEQADSDAAKRAALDWSFLRPEIERVLSERSATAEAVAVLRAAAKAEVEAALAAAGDWSGWLNGGDSPERVWIPRGDYSGERDKSEFPALMAYYNAAPNRSAFHEAVLNLISKGTFKRRVRYCWGREQRDAYPTGKLIEICRGWNRAALEDVSHGFEIGWTGAPLLMRVGSDGRVETTRGARVPLAIVKRAWDRFGPIVVRAAAGADCLTDEDRATLAASLPYGLDPYTLTAIDAAGVIVGCHCIPPAEVVRFAASQGWTAGVPA